MIVASDDIKGGHDLPLESNYLSEQLQRVFKTVKLWHGDNNINKMSPLKYFREVINSVNEMGMIMCCTLALNLWSYIYCINLRSEGG